MYGRPKGGRSKLRSIAILAAVAAAAVGTLTAAAATHSESTASKLKPTFTRAVAFDKSLPLRTLVKNAQRPAAAIPLERGPLGADRRLSIESGTGSSAFGSLHAQAAARTPATISPPLVSFEGISNQDNFDIFGFRVNPPDPVGDVGPSHYVEMVNLAFAVYDKTGNLLLGPSDIGSLWAGFPVADCTDASGDPVVIYDQKTDRWLLTQFTTAGPEYFNCVAISATGDPTGAYFRYAFSTGLNFPDYPKYGVWSNMYIVTTREFGPTIEYGIGVYGLEKNKMVDGNPNARAVSFFLDGNAPGMLPLVGDGLLPPDLDGNKQPTPHDVAAPIVGTQDDDAFYGATSDALNIWELQVHWKSTPTASIALATQLPVDSFDSIFPCGPDSRDCLPQPGIVNPAQYLDTLSYRQRPTYRLAYRNFKKYEALVTNQSVEALPGIAGVRWYEIRRTDGSYSLYQQGTHVPIDGVHRWMGSIAMDKKGDMGLGYSVVNGVDVFPGIRYTGRLAGDPLGLMTLGEGTIIDGDGVQTSTNSRWGDYTSMNIDPTDDCTFWYVNEYYTLAGQLSSSAGWQTRIASFKFPECS